MDNIVPAILSLEARKVCDGGCTEKPATALLGWITGLDHTSSGERPWFPEQWLRQGPVWGCESWAWMLRRAAQE